MKKILPGEITFTLILFLQTHDKFFAREIIEDFATEYSIGAPKNSSPTMEDIKIIEPPGFISD